MLRPALVRAVPRLAGRRILALLVLAMAALAMAPATAQMPISCPTAAQPIGHSSVVRIGAGGLVIVTSGTGIGRAVLGCAGARWPDVLRLQLHYVNGRPFRRLEGLTVRVSGGTWHRLPRSFPGEDGLVRIEWPRGMLPIPRGAAIEVHWVDAYRM